ncbi:MAG: hypothetical protein ABI910_08175 [Gemmatimonadota bacterium]
MTLEICRREMDRLLTSDNASSLATEEAWTTVADIAKRWFAFVKVAESYDTWEKALGEERMTMRGIHSERQIGTYVAPVARVDGRSQENRHDVRNLQGVAGMRERMNSANFSGAGKVMREKYAKGLWDASAVLVNPRVSLRIGGGAMPAAAAQRAAIPQAAPPRPAASGGPPPPPPPPAAGLAYNQIYRLSGDATYVFMPVPDEADMRIFYLLTHVSKTSTSPGFKQWVTYMKSRFTRITFTFGGDGGTTYTDFAPAGELQPKIKFGFGKQLSGTLSKAEIHQRRLVDTQYKQVLTSGTRHEIVIAYRQHGLLAQQPSRFPVWAKGVFAPNAHGPLIHRGYAVVDEAMQPVGRVIDLRGTLHDGTAETLGGRLDLFLPEEPAGQ